MLRPTNQSNHNGDAGGQGFAVPIARDPARPIAIPPFDAAEREAGDPAL